MGHRSVSNNSQLAAVRRSHAISTMHCQKCCERPRPLLVKISEGSASHVSLRCVIALNKSIEIVRSKHLSGTPGIYPSIFAPQTVLSAQPTAVCNHVWHSLSNIHFSSWSGSHQCFLAMPVPLTQNAARAPVRPLEPALLGRALGVKHTKSPEFL